MRRTVAAIVLAGLVSMTTMVPSASAQIPGLESWGFSGNTPFHSTSVFGPGPVQCQFGGFLNTAGVGGGVAGVGIGNVTPFFTASASGPVPPIPGPCTPPPFLLGGLGGLGVGGVGAGGISSLTLAQALGLGIATTTTSGGVTSVTIAGQTRTLTAGQSLSNTTVGTLFPNLGVGAGAGLGVNGLGFNTGLTGLGGLGGLGTGFGFNTGLGGLGTGGLGGFGGVTGVVR